MHFPQLKINTNTQWPQVFVLKKLFLLFEALAILLLLFFIYLFYRHFYLTVSSTQYLDSSVIQASKETIGFVQYEEVIQFHQKKIENGAGFVVQEAQNPFEKRTPAE